MKKILILLIFSIFCLSNLCFGASKHLRTATNSNGVYSAALKSNLGTVEEVLFGTEYSGMAVPERIKQAEILVYGRVTSHKSYEARVNKLVKDMHLQIAQQPSNFRPVANKTPTKPLTTQKPQVAQQSYQYENDQDDEPSQANTPDEKYPVVDKMETQIYNKSYPTENIYSRLKRLEMSTFNKSYENESLSQRVERLKAKILKIRPDDPVSDDEDWSSQINSGQPLTQAQTLKVVEDLEIMGLKTTYPSEPLKSRISRLETHYLNQTFPDDNTQTRLERIGAIAMAEPGAKEYENLPTINKIQDTATYVKLGSILLMILGMFF